MKFLTVIVFLIVATPVAANAAEPRPVSEVLERFLAALPENQGYAAEIDDFVAKLDRKKRHFKTDQQFLQYIFAQVHQTHLKRFQPFAKLGDLFETGTYNCLTATILFSSLLDHYHIDHEVVETNYHIFILAHTSEGDVLIESTDARAGFVTSPEEIQERIAIYKKNSLHAPAEDLAYYRFSFSLFNHVSQNELVGLLYYNLSVEAFNQNRIREAVNYLSKAGERYVSPRIEAFSEILLVAVHESKLDNAEKHTLKKSLQTTRYKALAEVASLEGS